MNIKDRLILEYIGADPDYAQYTIKDSKSPLKHLLHNRDKDDLHFHDSLDWIIPVTVILRKELNKYKKQLRPRVIHNGLYSTINEPDKFYNRVDLIYDEVAEAIEKLNRYFERYDKDVEYAAKFLIPFLNAGDIYHSDIDLHDTIKEYIISNDLKTTSMSCLELQEIINEHIKSEYTWMTGIGLITAMDEVLKASKENGTI